MLQKSLTTTLKQYETKAAFVLCPFVESALQDTYVEVFQTDYHKVFFLEYQPDYMNGSPNAKIYKTIIERYIAGEWFPAIVERREHIEIWRNIWHNTAMLLKETEGTIGKYIHIYNFNVNATQWTCLTQFNLYFFVKNRIFILFYL